MWTENCNNVRYLNLKKIVTTCNKWTENCNNVLHVN